MPSSELTSMENALEMSETTNTDNVLCLENQVCFSLYSAANAMVRAYRPMLDKLD